MSYAVKEMFLTLQGEGAQTGRVAVFLRFAGCNLWSGLERDRADAVCSFCDTDFVGTDGQNGGKFKTAEALVARVGGLWPETDSGQKWVVCTGGEPLLQLDADLIDALHTAGFKIAVESNGTIAAPAGIDWLCVSPKADAPLVQTSGDELKLVYPQNENRPEDFAHLGFKRFSIQPLDVLEVMPTAREKKAAHIQAALKYCLSHPQWRLSLQTHKILGID